MIASTFKIIFLYKCAENDNLKDYCVIAVAKTIVEKTFSAERDKEHILTR